MIATRRKYGWTLFGGKAVRKLELAGAHPEHLQLSMDLNKALETERRTITVETAVEEWNRLRVKRNITLFQQDDYSVDLPCDHLISEDAK